MPFGTIMLSSHKVIMVEFIKMYKSMSFLWDKTHRNYQNRPLRMKAYKKLLEKYQEIDDEATLPILKGKMDNMRTSYIRELKKVRASKKNDGSERKHLPSLWYYDLFSFLENHVVLKQKSQMTVRADTDNSLTSEDFTFYDDYNESNQSNTENMPVEYLEDFDDFDTGDSCSEVRHKIKEEPAEAADGPGSDWEVIGRAVGIQLRDVPPHQAAIAQKLIADTLFHAKLGRLTEHSAITNSVDVCAGRGRRRRRPNC